MSSSVDASPSPTSSDKPKNIKTKGNLFDKINNLVEKSALSKTQLRLVYLIISIGLVFLGVNIAVYFDSIVLSNYLSSLLHQTFPAEPANKIQVFTSSAFNFMKAINTLISLASFIIGGVISDNLRSKYGNRPPALLFGAIVAGLCYISSPLMLDLIGPLFITIGPFVFSFTLLIAYILIAIGLGFVWAPGYALISELFTKAERGWAAMGLAVVSAFGPFVGIILQHLFGINYGILMTATGILLIVFGILTFVLLPKQNPPFPPGENVVKEILNTPIYLLTIGKDTNKKANNSFLLMFLVQICLGISLFILTTNFPVLLYILSEQTSSYLAGLNGLTSGIALIILGVCGVLLAMPVGIMISKIGKTKSAMIGSILFSIAAFLLAQDIFWNFSGLILIIIVIAGGSIIISTVTVALPADLVPRGKEGQFMGLFTVATGFFNPVIALASSYILGLSTDPYGNYSNLFLIAAIVELAAIGLLFFINYESTFEGEYKAFRNRYLIYRGYLASELGEIEQKLNFDSHKTK